MRKFLVLAAFVAFAPIAAFAATVAPVAKSPVVVTTIDKTSVAPKIPHNGKHHMLVKKQKTSAKPNKMNKTPATKT
jgi:hypothetical protein